MPKTIQCPECDAELDLPPNAAGKKVRCPDCSAVVKVPAGKPSAPVPRDDARPKPHRRRDEEDDDEEYDEPHHPAMKKKGPNIPGPVWVAYGVCAAAVIAGLVFAVIQYRDWSQRRTAEKERIAAELKGLGKGGGGRAQAANAVPDGAGFRLNPPRPLERLETESDDLARRVGGEAGAYLTAPAGGPAVEVMVLVAKPPADLPRDRRFRSMLSGKFNVFDLRNRAVKSAKATTLGGAPSDEYRATAADTKARQVIRMAEVNDKAVVVVVEFPGDVDDAEADAIFDSFALE